MNIKILLYLISLFVLTIFYNCSKDTTAVDEDNIEYSSVLVDVRAMVHDQLVVYSSSGVKDYPRNPVVVDILVYEDNKTEYTVLSTTTTDDEGFALFDSIQAGRYKFIPRKNDEICEVISKTIEVSNKSKQDTVIIGVGYKWNLMPVNFDIVVDTSSIGSTNMHKFLFINSGLLDTLNCTFDMSQVPNWINLEFSTNIFPPTYESVWDYYVKLEYEDKEIPFQDLPLSFDIEIQHQFDTVSINFKVAEEE